MISEMDSELFFTSIVNHGSQQRRHPLRDDPWRPTPLFQNYRQDPIFNNTSLPISTKIGYPLVMARKIDGLPFGQETDNVHATWLNINPVDGFAPQYWQGGIGDVVVAKADKSALTPDELGGVVDYVSAILDAFGDGATPVQMYNRNRLDQFMGN
jgi:hypothetical protein